MGSKRVEPVQLAGSAMTVLPGGVTFLQPEDAVLEAMLDGWAAQQRSRLLTTSTIENRGFAVRRFVAYTNEYPWSWRPADVEEWTSALVAQGLAHGTIRGYQMAVALFVGYICDPRYGWAPVCEGRFGTHPTQVFHEWNTAVHRSDSEARPDRRPLSREELQAFFDHADDQVGRVTTAGRKGWLAAYRDAVLFKTMYAWGLRRRETAMLDVTDWGPNAKAPQFGRFGVLNVRYGKASRGSPPRQRSVLTTMAWAAEAVAEWVSDIRPAYDPTPHQVLRPVLDSERRWAIARRLVADETIAVADRVAGALVVLYGQPRPGWRVSRPPTSTAAPTEP